ncbi:hypothetical protein [Thaumasiovibrio subtropicus]|uniref:hypothetical protein n=1 Tax=Thaumasiovibrio subtropicus TaxID=1891207 RepID=UPI000B34B84F|nr:hypothetical protein [Thaumasiovibrio subtropicus]
MRSLMKWHDKKLLSEAKKQSKGRCLAFICVSIILSIITFFLFSGDKAALTINLLLGGIIGANIEKLVTIRLYSSHLKTQGSEAD